LGLVSILLILGYLSYVLVGLTILIGGSIITDLVGIFVGHIYFFLNDIITEEYEINLLKTPFFM
jgi:Derlin-2/3